jgi:hypothetical protein
MMSSSMQCAWTCSRAERDKTAPSLPTIEVLLNLSLREVASQSDGHYGSIMSGPAIQLIGLAGHQQNRNVSVNSSL